MRRNPPAPFGLRAARGRQRRCRRSNVLTHRLRADALHSTPRGAQRDPDDFHHGLLGAGRVGFRARWQAPQEMAASIQLRAGERSGTAP